MGVLEEVFTDIHGSSPSESWDPCSPDTNLSIAQVGYVSWLSGVGLDDTKSCDGILATMDSSL
jgi:hypothetical protein